MKIEIAIEGPPHAISELGRRLAHLSPSLEEPPDPGDGQAKVLLMEEEKTLNERLMEISRIVNRAEKDLSLRKKFEFKVRNLSYTEPPGGGERQREAFNPIPSITIQPWHPSTARSEGPSTVFIDSQHAFGNGRHPTSRLCLASIEDLAQAGLREGLQGKRVLDFGCGTGLLAIAAVRMGAGHALGVEADPLSVETAKKNMRLNGLSGRITIRKGSWEVVRGEYDLVLANLVPAVLLRTGGRITSHLKEDGTAVISGFSDRQLMDMERHFTRAGLIKKESATLDGWAALTMVKRRIGIPGTRHHRRIRER
ncbi:MAG: 50S ribosomal protein L11 methyltransferase [Proteobacteria bacterium]|nr:50S ribosomal protein L11 methyltransferase [Pseudomonadota bacterium]